MSQPQVPQTATGGGWRNAFQNARGQTVYSENTDGSVNLTGVYFPDGTYQTTAATASAGALDVATAAATAPSPLYSPTESPSTINPNIYVQDVNGNWHAQAGVDVTTTDVAGTGPPAPDGTLTWTRRMYARDTLSPTQTFKNAFLSVNHSAGVGTASTNQDRAIGLNMCNISASIYSFSITSNVVTLSINTALSTFATPVFQVGMTVRATGLATGTYLNNQTLTITSVTLISASNYAITAAFTHANVGLTSDTGKLDQFIYSMAGIQAELDVYGTPQFAAAIDSELRTLSLQCADYTTGNPSAPAYGIGCLRAEYFRQTGATGWGSIDPSVINVKVTNNSTASSSGGYLNGIIVKVDSTGTTPSNTSSRAIWINAPNPTYRFSNNIGLYIDDFGSTNPNADFAIYVGGGVSRFSGMATNLVSKVANYTATITDGTILCNGTFTITLPGGANAMCTGQIIRVKNTGSGTVTISAASGNIDGTTSKSIAVQYNSLTFQWDGTQWWTI